MSPRIELVQAAVSSDRTTYRVMVDDTQVGTAAELTTDVAAPWRLTVPGHCANLRRSSREVVLATVERLLGTRSQRPVVYVPANPGSHWDGIAAELHAAGFEVLPAPMPESQDAVHAPMVVCPREDSAMPYHLTSAQRCVLADSVRAGLLGWLLTCPVAGRQSRILEGKATNILGFGFSRFATLAATHFGKDYHPRCITGAEFPLSISEASALANDIELGFATPDQLRAAGLIAAFSPYGQPEVGSRDWRAYLTALDVIGLDLWGGDPTWKEQVTERLRPFRRAVAASAITTHAAE
jgi:hypothetical protein